MSFGLGTLQRRIFGPIIPVVRIQGMMNDLCVAKLEKSLNHISPARSQAIAVLVNSPGGFPAPCLSMVEILKIYSKKHHLPLYTFAEDFACSGGYLVLVAGDKVYADKTSWVGSIGAISQLVQAQGLLKKYKIDVKTWKTNENLLAPSMDAFADVDKETANKNFKKLSEDIHEKFIQHVESYREKKISVPKEERKEKLYQADIWTGKEAANLGLVDGLGTYQEVLAREFPDAKLVEVTKTSFAERVRERMALGASLAESWDGGALLKKVTMEYGKKI